MTNVGKFQSRLSVLEQLVSSVPSVKEAAWSELYLEVYPSLREFVLKNSGSENDAADTFQDALVVLHRSVNDGKFRADSAIPTYVIGVAKNIWFNELARRRKQVNLDQEVVFDNMTSNDNNHLMTVEVVKLLLSELKEDCRQILTEYYYNNKSMAELMEIFNVNSIQATKNKKWRCLGYLIKMFKERSPIRLQAES